jgi:hypothetical protein
MNSVGSQVSDGVRTGYIYHNPSACSKEGNCNYMFLLKNTASEPKVVTIRVSSQGYNPSDVKLQLDYKNIVQYGQFLNYEINPTVNADI